MKARSHRSSHQSVFHWSTLVLSLALAAQFTADETALAGVSANRGGDRSVLVQGYGRLPLAFEANQGQADETVRFVARGNGFTLFLTPGEAVLAFQKVLPTTRKDGVSSSKGECATAKREIQWVRLKFSHGDPGATVVGRDSLPGKINHLIGNNPDRWRRNVPTYSKVQYQKLYPGVDLVYYGNQRQLECDFVVAPNGNPGAAILEVEGARGLEKDAAGDLILQLSDGSIRLGRPVAYQEIDGVKREVACSFELKENNRIGFCVGAYDDKRTLVIDPVIGYASYLGGIGADAGESIAVDVTGSAYVTGTTTSPDFKAPQGVLDGSLDGASDAFITKFDPSGSNVVYSTYLGGDGNESGFGIAVDGDGNAFITGMTDSSNFPKTPGAFKRSAQGGSDAFVAKLDANGANLIYATYLGGKADDEGNGIALDESGDAFVVGTTHSSDFPNTSGAFKGSLRGASDAFVTEIDPSGSNLVYSTYLGGDSQEEGLGIAVDEAGNAFVTGMTGSSDFPKTPGSLDQSLSGLTDAFVTKVQAGGSNLVYSTFLGGSGTDVGQGIAVDSDGQAYVTGETDSTNFPKTPGAYDGSLSKGTDAFVSKLNADGSALVYSTYLGGSGDDSGTGIAVDADRNAHVVGTTSSKNFPATPGAPDRSFQAPTDVFVTKVSAGGSNLLYSTFLGGKGSDSGAAIALDAAGNDYVTGETDSDGFPTTKGSFQKSLKAVSDAFVAKLAISFGPAHDLAVTSLTAPKRITLSAKKPSISGTVQVVIQNRSQHDEIISDVATLESLVTLTVNSLGKCSNPVPLLTSVSTSLPAELSPSQTLTLTYTVIFDCANDGEKTSKNNPGHDDYSYTATVHHNVLDGEADDHPVDDVCPHDALPGGVDPNPDGTIGDNGCGGKNSDGTYGAPVVTDVVQK